MMADENDNNLIPVSGVFGFGNNPNRESGLTCPVLIDRDSTGLKDPVFNGIA